MGSMLFAQFNPNAPGFQIGVMIGIVIAVILSAAIPIAFGVARGRPGLGVAGGACTIPAAVLLGCLGGLPVALLFVAVIAVVSSGDQKPAKRRKKKPRDFDEDEDEDNDRPRQARRETYDQHDDDRPRRLRRDEDDDPRR